MNGIDQLVAGTNTALESLRELTRGVFPTQLARAGIEPALRSFLARSGLAATLYVDPSAAGKRFSPRVEAAVTFCAAEAVGAAAGLRSIELSVTGPDLLLRIDGDTDDTVDRQAIVDRVDAVGGSLVAENDQWTLRIPVGADQPAYALLGGGGPGL